jgi:hypothetical protein
MTIAKKSSRIRVAGRSQLAEGVAQRREYARNYAKFRKAVGKVLDECWDQADGYKFSDSINRTVSELVGCRITEIGDGDIEAALACVNAMRHLIRNFDAHCKYVAYWHEQNQREREKQQASNGHSAWFNNLVSDIRQIVDRQRGTPTLSLVPDCGRNLLPHDSDTPPGPYSA